MSERLESFLKPGQEISLKQMGKRGDLWHQLLEEAGGDEVLAEMLAEVRGVEEFGGISQSEKPRLQDFSPRVVFQKHAARTQR